MSLPLLERVDFTVTEDSKALNETKTRNGAEIANCTLQWERRNGARKWDFRKLKFSNSHVHKEKKNGQKREILEDEEKDDE